jgi:hypothetical protein
MGFLGWTAALWLSTNVKGTDSLIRLAALIRLFEVGWQYLLECVRQAAVELKGAISYPRSIEKGELFHVRLMKLLSLFAVHDSLQYSIALVRPNKLDELYLFPKV